MPWDVHYVAETGSTNTDLLAMAKAGAAAGTVLRASHQTAGRGRLGRTWVAPPDACLLVSVLLRPADGPSFWDTAAVACAAAAACRRLCAVQPLLKWPNDLMLGDRKLAGLLAEADLGTGAVVVGCGLNLTLPPDSPVASTAIALSQLVADPPSPQDLLDSLLGELDRILGEGTEGLRRTWMENSATIGRTVRVETGSGQLVGRAESLDESGALVVDGTTVRAGDVVHLRPL